MNTANFSEYLQNPSLLYQITYEELKTLIVQYPYSQNLRYLIAQKSNMENNGDYEHFLRSAAIISTDRAHLYHILKLQKAEPALEDNFILEEEALELKELDKLDLNEVQLEPVLLEDSTERLDLNVSNELERQEAVFDTFPELNPEASSDLDELPSLDALEEEIALPTLEEESIAELLDEADSVSDEVEDENAIEALIDATATETVAGVATVASIAALLDTEEVTEVEPEQLMEEVEIEAELAPNEEENITDVVEEVEEISLQELFETEVADETPEVEIDENDTEETEAQAILKFTPPPAATSIQEILGGAVKNTPRRRKRRTLKVQQPQPVAPVEVAQKEIVPVQKVVVEQVAAEQKVEDVALNLKRKEEQAEEYASKSIEESMDIASETYASLLIRQNQADKAIQVYERLKLIFPEKSAFFAEQIENLRQKS